MTYTLRQRSRRSRAVSNPSSASVGRSRRPTRPFNHSIVLYGPSHNSRQLFLSTITARVCPSIPEYNRNNRKLHNDSRPADAFDVNKELYCVSCGRLGARRVRPSPLTPRLVLESSFVGIVPHSTLLTESSDDDVCKRNYRALAQRSPHERYIQIYCYRQILNNKCQNI